jgi:hypothetical protein
MDPAYLDDRKTAAWAYIGGLSFYGTLLKATVVIV